MKNTYILLLALALMATACSEKKTNTDLSGPGVDPTVVVPPAPPGGSSPTPPVYTSGATADMTINMAAYVEYTGRTANSPSQFKINVDLRDVDTSAGFAYGGSVKISYQEIDTLGNPVYYQGSFTSGTSVSEARYNKYVPQGSETWFKAMFEDLKGTIVIVVDSMDEFGNWGGKVFFRNFQCGRHPWDPICNPDRPRRSWLVSTGPYDTTPFKVSPYKRINDPIDGSNYSIWKVNTSTREYPEDYTQLGTFSGMDKNKALNQ